MKRDMDLMRAILLDIEALSEPSRGYYFLESTDEDVFQHNMALLVEKNLVSAKQWGSHDRHPGRWFAMVALTWAGSDFLDTVRDDEIWRNTKAGVKAVGGFSFDMMKSLAKGLVKKQIEKHTGIELDI
jgi:hypothetical protein